MGRRDGPVHPPLATLSGSWPLGWLVPFEVGQTDARSSVLVYEMQPSKMSSV